MERPSTTHPPPPPPQIVGASKKALRLLFCRVCESSMCENVRVCCRDSLRFPTDCRTVAGLFFVAEFPVCRCCYSVGSLMLVYCAGGDGSKWYGFAIVASSSSFPPPCNIHCVHGEGRYFGKRRKKEEVRFLGTQRRKWGSGGENPENSLKYISGSLCTGVLYNCFPDLQESSW